MMEKVIWIESKSYLSALRHMEDLIVQFYR